MGKTLKVLEAKLSSEVLAVADAHVAQHKKVVIIEFDAKGKLIKCESSLAVPGVFSAFLVKGVAEMVEAKAALGSGFLEELMTSQMVDKSTKIAILRDIVRNTKRRALNGGPKVRRLPKTKSISVNDMTVLT